MTLLKRALACALLSLSIALGACASREPAPAPAARDQITWRAPQTIEVVSFNIKWLGHYRDKDYQALADLLAPYDLVFVQELVAPPYPGTFPDGEAYNPDAEAAAFFDSMEAHGFEYALSSESTGTSEGDHRNSTATEWFVAFYKPGLITFDEAASDFIAEDRRDHADFERVPYAFAFDIGSEDLVFISVHLEPGSSAASEARRAQELDATWRWIRSRRGAERDYVILGDMNIEDCDELAALLPRGAVSLNDACEGTNLRANKPYDHVMLRSQFTSAEIPAGFDVIDLIEAMRDAWDNSDGAYPGDPLQAGPFAQYYSDHHPVVFRVTIDGQDDD